MADVLVRMKADNSDFKRKMDEAKKKSKELAEEQKALKSAFGTVTTALGGVAAAIGMAQGAGEAFNKLIGSTQTLTDEFGRQMEAAKSSVDTFFNSLAMGDFSNFTSNIIAATAAARDYYNQMDMIATMDVFRPQEMQAITNEITRQRLILRDKSSSSEQKEEAKKKIAELENKAMEQTKQYSEQLNIGYMSSYRKKLTEYGATGSDEYLNKMINKYLDTFGSYSEAGKRFAELDKQRRSMMVKGTVASTNSQGFTTYQQVYTDTAESAKLRNSMEYRVLRAIVELGDESLKETRNLRGKALSADAQVLALKSGSIRYTGGGSTGGSGVSAAKEIVPEGSIAKIQQQIAEAQKAVNAATTDEARASAYQVVEDLKAKLAQTTFVMKYQFNPANGVGSGTAPAGVAQGVTIPDKLPLKDFSSMNQSMDAGIDKTALLTSGIMGMSSALSSFGNLAQEGEANWLQMTSTMLSGAAQMIQALASLTAAEAASSAAQTPIVGWLSVGAAIASALAAFSTIPGFADGGIVAGNSYSGDKVVTRLNSGELVLNKAQQNNLASQLTDKSSADGYNQHSYVSGEQIITVVNNVLRRKGCKNLLGM